MDHVSLTWCFHSKGVTGDFRAKCPESCTFLVFGWFLGVDTGGVGNGSWLDLLTWGTARECRLVRPRVSFGGTAAGVAPPYLESGIAIPLIRNKT